MSEIIKEIVKRLEKQMDCNCDLDNWQPERLTEHSIICRIHMKAVSELGGTKAEKCKHEITGGWRLEGEPIMTSENYKTCPFCPEAKKKEYKWHPCGCGSIDEKCNIHTAKDRTAEIIFREEDGGFIASYNAFSGFGKTKEEAWKELATALSLALDVVESERSKASGEREAVEELYICGPHGYSGCHCDTVSKINKLYEILKDVKDCHEQGISSVCSKCMARISEALRHERKETK